MKEYPILFNGDMVRAILDGRKTQTRRVIVPQPECDCGTWFQPGKMSKTTAEGWRAIGHSGKWWCGCGRCTNGIRTCPYGVPGENLWVREKTRVVGMKGSPVMGEHRVTEIHVKYEADGKDSGWIPYPERLKGEPHPGKCLSYGGYRESSRVTLEVTDVRVERVQDISECDSISEGILTSSDFDAQGPDEENGKPALGPTPKQRFKQLWDSINEKRGFGWDVNPWVWVVDFKMVEEQAEYVDIEMIPKWDEEEEKKYHEEDESKGKQGEEEVDGKEEAEGE